MIEVGAADAVERHEALDFFLFFFVWSRSRFFFCESNEFFFRNRRRSNPRLLQ